MCTWISRVAVLVAALALAGCAATAARGPAAGDDVQSLTVANGFTVAGPFGYCPDPDLSRDLPDGAFVVLQGCEDADRPLVLTALVAPSTGVSVADAAPTLAAFFETEAGRGALSRAQDPATVTVMGSRVEDAALILEVSDTSADVVEGLADDYWRLVFDVGGRLVTLTATPREGAGLSDAQILAVLAAFRARLQADNA